MKKKFGFSFKCDENPMKMEKTSVVNGEQTIETRHCNNCERNIVDFTKFTPQQIADYIKNNKKPCGFMFPWQEDEINAYLDQQDANTSSPLMKIAKIAAVAGSPLLFNPAVAQKLNPDIEINTNRNTSNNTVTELILKDVNGLAIDSLKLEIYSGSQLLTTLETDEFGKIAIDHSLYTGKNVLIIKNIALNLEKSIALKGESTCIVWETTFSREEQILAEQLNKYDFQFIYRGEKEKPIRNSKVDIQLYDTTNTLIETVGSSSNMSGYSLLKTGKIGQVKYISFVIYTNKGRRTAYLNVNELSKTEVNIVKVNKKFRQYHGGVTYTRFTP
jgi:hypothetical protein